MGGISEWMGVIGSCLNPMVLFYLLVGTIAGYVIGVLPGLSATMGIALLTPLTFWLPEAQGFAMLIGVFNAGIFSGGISAILINTPGTPASIATTFDGYALTKQGKPGLALGLNTIFSCIGGWLGTLILIVAAFPLANFALKFGPAEFFALAIFGLTMMVSVSGQSIVKGLMTGFFGLLISCIGTDPMLGMPRFTFQIAELMDGISFIAVMIGLFGLGEVLYQMYNGEHRGKADTITTMGRVLPTWDEFKRCLPGSIIGTIISVIVGAIPGTGGDIAGLIGWDQAKRISKKPEEFGHGSVEGVAVTCLANNACLGGSLVTMMTLGVPGESISAVLLGSLMMYGMDPGPTLFTEHRTFVITFMVLMMLAYGAILFIGLLTAKYSTIIINIRKEIIWITVIALCVIGSYAMNSSYIDVLIMAASGVIGFLFRKLDFPLGPVILGLLLGRMAESNFRRALSLGGMTYKLFYTKPIAVILFILAVLAVGTPVYKKLKEEKNKQEEMV
ncbi:tripartite tricarboxylate transporter permease [Lachnospiraceae bacterium 62-35]